MSTKLEHMGDDEQRRHELAAERQTTEAAKTKGKEMEIKASTREEERIEGRGFVVIAEEVWPVVGPKRQRRSSEVLRARSLVKRQRFCKGAPGLLGTRSGAVSWRVRAPKLSPLLW